MHRLGKMTMLTNVMNQCHHRRNVVSQELINLVKGPTLLHDFVLQSVVDFPIGATLLMDDSVDHAVITHLHHTHGLAA